MSEKAEEFKPEDVQYLSFEGGGGKGGAFIGAIWALESLVRINWTQHPDTNRRILDRSKIKGLSGSSAGALTAVFLSCGYTTNEIKGIVLKSGKRGLFYDEALPRKKPKIVLQRQLAVSDSCIKPQDSKTKLKYFQYITGIIFKRPVVGDLWAKALKALSGGKEPLKRILDKNNLPRYLWNLVEDFGLMSGCNARSAIDELVAFKTRDEKGNRIYGATFRQHYKYHKIKLVVTGTDLEGGRTQYFSVDETPDFRVSDAVRISMSFPYVFKPIIIKEGKLKGTWVDGGLLNNIPIHAFDPPPGGVNQ